MIRLADPSFSLVGIIFLSLFFKRKPAFLGYSHLPLLETDGEWRWGAHLPPFLLATTIALLILALARPQWHKAVQRESFLARDILLVVDLSHSMENTVKSTVKAGNAPRKIDVAKKAALQFIEKRKNDRIGLLVFGDETFGSWPLTRDLSLISKKVGRLGSTFYGGTNLVGPFLRAMEHFREMGQSANRVLVFLSDGESTIRSEMKEMIVREMKKIGVHLYLVGIDLRKENSDILEIVNRVQGRFIAAESATGLAAAFDEIDRLEPSMVEIELQGDRQELYPIVLSWALCLLFILTLLGNTLFIELC